MAIYQLKAIPLIHPFFFLNMKMYHCVYISCLTCVYKMCMCIQVVKRQYLSLYLKNRYNFMTSLYINVNQGVHILFPTTFTFINKHESHHSSYVLFYFHMYSSFVWWFDPIVCCLIQYSGGSCMNYRIRFNHELAGAHCRKLKARATSFQLPAWPLISCQCLNE